MSRSGRGRRRVQEVEDSSSDEETEVNEKQQNEDNEDLEQEQQNLKPKPLTYSPSNSVKKVFIAHKSKSNVKLFSKTYSIFTFLLFPILILDSQFMI